MSQRTSRYVIIALSALRICQQVFPTYSHPKSPHRFTLPQLTASVLLMFHLHLSYRDMEEWLLATDGVVKALGLKEVPDHTTLYRAYRRFRVKDLERLNGELLKETGMEGEEGIVVDTTGFQPTQASVHYLARSGRRYEHFIKGCYAVGIASQLILGVVSGRGPGADSVHLASLRAKAALYGAAQGWMLLADRGFDGRCVGRGDLIPPIRRGGKLQRPDRVARAELVAAAILDGYYGQRWKVETVNSVIKRKFGDGIRSRKLNHRQREVYVKALVYNIHR